MKNIVIIGAKWYEMELKFYFTAGLKYLCKVGVEGGVVELLRRFLLPERSRFKG